jgi:hypothetical protein
MEMLTTIGFGAKAYLPYNMVLTIGVRDFFNREPNQRILGYSGGGESIEETNVMYPNPGRTIFATLNFNY